MSWATDRLEEKLGELHRKLDNTNQRLDKLEQQQIRQTKNLGKLNIDSDKHTHLIERSKQAIDLIKEELGIEDLYTMFIFSDSSRARKQVKAFNVKDKLDAIMKHLGLIESVELGNKLVAAPKKKASK